jgi:hypothetical protein
MTPQVLETREERDDNQLSTSDVVAAKRTPGGSTMTIGRSSART